MRYRVKNYEIYFPAGQIQIIKLTDLSGITIEDIRLIVNETQNIVICSSMQKSLINSVYTGAGGFVCIDVPKSTCNLALTDKLTIEIDRGEDATLMNDQVERIAQRLNVADAYTVTEITDAAAETIVKNHLKNVYGTVSAQAGGTAADEHIAAAIVNLNGVPTKLYRHYLYAGSRKTITVTQGSQTMTIQVPDTGYGLTELWRKRTAAGTWVHYCQSPQAGEQSIATLHPTLETYNAQGQILEQDYIVTTNPNQQ